MHNKLEGNFDKLKVNKIIRKNSVHILNEDLEKARNIFKIILKEKVDIFLGFTGQMLNEGTYSDLLKLVKISKKIVITPCALLYEIEKFKIDLKAYKNTKWEMSRFLNEIGKNIEDDNSFLHYSYKKGIDVFLPIIEGRLADIFIENELFLDVLKDIGKLNKFTAFCKNKTACIIFGIGLVKHHILNANLFKEGSDYTILVNTAVEFDGSDAGAEIEEAKSWGKVQMEGEGIKLRCCPTLILNLLLKNIL